MRRRRSPTRARGLRHGERPARGAGPAGPARERRGARRGATQRGGGGRERLDDDSDDDDDDGSDDSDEEDFERDSDVDSDSDGTAAGSSPPDEETEAQFLARYAAEARRLAGAGDVDPDSGDVEDADDGSELELDGVMMGPPGSEARALLNWLQSRATAADLGALAATLQAHPVDGLEQVSNLQTVLSSIPQAAGGGGRERVGRTQRVIRERWVCPWTSAGWRCDRARLYHIILSAQTIVLLKLLTDARGVNATFGTSRLWTPRWTIGRLSSDVRIRLERGPSLVRSPASRVAFAPAVTPP